MSHNKLQGSAIDMVEPDKKLLGRQIEGPGWMGLMPEKAAAEHRCERQGDESRNEDCYRNRNRELPQQTSDDPAHEEYRNEYGHERNRHRENGESNLASSVESRAHARLTHLHVP